MDKATSENKILLGAFRKRSKNAGLDSRVCVCSGSHCQEEIYASAIALRNSTDFKHIHFRKNAHKSTVSADSITMFQRTKS